MEKELLGSISSSSASSCSAHNMGPRISATDLTNSKWREDSDTLSLPEDGARSLALRGSSSLPVRSRTSQIISTMHGTSSCESASLERCGTTFRAVRMAAHATSRSSSRSKSRNSGSKVSWNSAGSTEAVVPSTSAIVLRTSLSTSWLLLTSLLSRSRCRSWPARPCLKKPALMLKLSKCRPCERTTAELSGSICGMTLAVTLAAKPSLSWSVFS
mmetsp:Transcript_19747/g.63409  ORF Transcript_19747/g.63409 Transcript_19747/m.63409 type:complete len:215 (+) Transcript_19747:883-1527(+)